MMIANENIGSFWSALIIEELARNGVTYFCLSPGSRSTPLITAVARHPQAQSIMIYDERAAAYHALGYARARGAPAALICTSGTAAANYFPAIVEAAQDEVPLIILTADRPPELRDSGANQTIDQVKIFGGYVRWFFDLPTPDTAVPAKFVLSCVDQLAAASLFPQKGPSHLNCMFREPLEPRPIPFDQGYMQQISGWLDSGEPWRRSYFPAAAVPGPNQDEIIRMLDRAEQGLIIAGRQDIGSDPQAIIRLAEKLNWPVFADITSGLKPWPDHPLLISGYDLIIGQANYDPSFALHLGGRFVSKRLQQKLEASTLQAYLQVSEQIGRTDPGHLVTHRLQADVAAFCQTVSSRITPKAKSAQAPELHKKSKRAEQAAMEVIQRFLPLNEPLIASLIMRHIPEDSGLFLSSSMPVREMDRFCGSVEKRLYIAANRGASGIDGVMASAAGFAAGLKRPVTLLIGDLALLHDLNSLAIIGKLKQPVCTILLNNHGGGIFHFLPIAGYPQLFEEFFAAPHGFSFAPAAKLFGLEYHTAGSSEEFSFAYKTALAAQKPALIEVTTDRRQTARLYQEIDEAVTAALSGEQK
jgi:2-succinyl-5-enolpyruvyl-6-hydroxy-3-cyclohexene-1-carboxylate synthase